MESAEVHLKLMDEAPIPLAQTKNDGNIIDNEKQKGELVSMIGSNDPILAEKERATWNNQLDFIVTLLGCIVGIGNLWRFSYLCYDNGGGTFLLCYAVALLTVGIPMNFTEIALGQYYKEGAITIWKISPIFKGVGMAGIIATAYWSTYAMVIFAWTLMYFYFSLFPELPWASCDNWWNTKTCVSAWQNLTCFSNGNDTKCNVTNSTSVPIKQLTDPVREFWDNRLLQRSSGVDDLGGIQWELFITLFLAYIIIFICIFKGIRWTGKIVYVTAIFPYFLIFVLLVRGVTLPGAVNGLKYYLYPDLSKLMDIHVWITAFSQVFYSFAIAYGMLTPMGSHNDFHNNFYKDSMMAVTLGAIWSFIAGFAVFSVIGFMAHEQQKPVEEVATSGTGLAFLVYPTAVLQMPYPQLWSGMFFLMLHMVILDTIFCCYEAIVTSLADVWPKYLKRSTELTAFVYCIIGFLFGIPFVTRGGIYLFEIFDYHAASGISIMTIALCECLVIGYVYGINRFWRNLEEMLKFKPSRWWKFCIKYITPGVTLTLLVATVVEWSPVKYMEYEYPTWAHVFGWGLTMSSALCVPLYAIWLICTTSCPEKTFFEKIKMLASYEESNEVVKSS